MHKSKTVENLISKVRQVYIYGARWGGEEVVSPVYLSTKMLYTHALQTHGWTDGWVDREPKIDNTF